LGLNLSTTVVIDKLLLIFCAAVGIFLFAYLASAEGYSPRVVAAAVLLTATSVLFVVFATRVASEMLYLPLSMAALIALKKYERAAVISRWLVISALVLVAAMLTRSVVVGLLRAAVLFLASKREFKRASLLILSAALLWSPWYFVSRKTGAGV